MIYENLPIIPWKIFNDYIFQFQNRLYRSEKSKKLFLQSNLEVLLKQSNIFGLNLIKRRAKKTFLFNSTLFRNHYKFQRLFFSPKILTYDNYLIHKDFVRQNLFINTSLVLKPPPFFIEQKLENIKNKTVNVSSDIYLNFLEIQKKETFLQKTFSSSWLLQLKVIYFIFQEYKFRDKTNFFQEHLDQTINITSLVQKSSFLKKRISSRKIIKNSTSTAQNLKKNKKFLRRKLKLSLFSVIIEPLLENKRDPNNYRRNSSATFYDAIESIFQNCRKRFWFYFFFQGHFLSNKKPLLFNYLKILYTKIFINNSKLFFIKNNVQHYPQRFLLKKLDCYYIYEHSQLTKFSWNKKKISKFFLEDKKQLVLFYKIISNEFLKIILSCQFYLLFFQIRIDLVKLTLLKTGNFCISLSTNAGKGCNVKKYIINLLFSYSSYLTLLTNYYFNYYLTFIFFTYCFFQLVYIKSKRIDSKNHYLTFMVNFANSMKFTEKYLSKSINMNGTSLFISRFHFIEFVSLITNQKLLEPHYSFFTLFSFNISSVNLTTKLLAFSLKRQGLFFYPFASKKQINLIKIIKFEDQIFMFSSNEKLDFQNVICLKEIEQKLTIIQKNLDPMSINSEESFRPSYFQETSLLKKNRLKKIFCSNYNLADYLIFTNFKKTRLYCLDFEIKNFETRKTGLRSYLIPSKKQILIHLQEISYIIKTSKTKTQENLISKLAPKILQWSKYYKNVSTKKIFNYCDYFTLKLVWKWACRKHPKKSRQWIKLKYFVSLNGKNWVFGIYQKNHFSYFCLPYHVDVPLVKHNKIINRKLPYDGDFKYWSKYFTN